MKGFEAFFFFFLFFRFTHLHTIDRTRNFKILKSSPNLQLDRSIVLSDSFSFRDMSPFSPKREKEAKVDWSSADEVVQRKDNGSLLRY